MAHLRSIAMLVALGLAGATLQAAPAHAAQRPGPPDPADTQAAPPQNENPDPAAASSPHQREATQQQPRDETAPNSSPDPESASTPHQKGALGQMPHQGTSGNAKNLVGMQVISPSGESLGSVIDVTMDAQRQPEYAVISTGNDTMTAVPYAAVASMVNNDKIIMDRTRLENSPQVAQSELRDKSNSKWRADADKYWSAAGVRMASPSGGTVDPNKPQPKER